MAIGHFKASKLIGPSAVSRLNTMADVADAVMGSGQINPAAANFAVFARMQESAGRTARDMADAIVTTGPDLVAAGIWSHGVTIGHWDMTTGASTGGVWTADMAEVTAFGTAPIPLGETCLVRYRGTDDTVLYFTIESGTGGTAGIGPFMVRVKKNGVDADGYPKYDIFAYTDSGLVAPLNLSGPVGPIDDVGTDSGRGRTYGRQPTIYVPAAPADGTIGLAYFDADGIIHLFEPNETICATT